MTENIQERINKHKGDVPVKNEDVLHKGFAKKPKGRRLNMCEANVYELQEKFDEYAEIFRKQLNIDKQVFAHLCMSWVVHEGEWKDE